jgi:hypothetical protein
LERGWKTAVLPKTFDASGCVWVTGFTIFYETFRVEKLGVVSTQADRREAGWYRLESFVDFVKVQGQRIVLFAANLCSCTIPRTALNFS